MIKVLLSRSMSCAAMLLFLFFIYPGWNGVPAEEQNSAVTNTRTPLNPTDSDRRESQTVILMTTVHDSQGQIITDLDKSDFVVHEDGVVQTISQFSRGIDRKKGAGNAGVSPLSLIILLDLSSSMSEWGKFGFARLIIEAVLEGLNATDEVCLITFSDLRVQTKVGFTQDRTAISSKLNTLHPQGKTAMYQAIHFLPELIAKARTSSVEIRMTDIDEPLPDAGAFLDIKRQAVILLTDGIDNKSIASLKHAIASANRIDIPIYPMVLAWQGEENNRDSHEYARTDILETIAATTGGKYTEFHAGADFETQLAPVLNELRFQYLIGYISTQGSTRGTWHQITVSVRKGKDFRVVTRKGYYSGD